MNVAVTETGLSVAEVMAINVVKYFSITPSLVRTRTEPPGALFPATLNVNRATRWIPTPEKPMNLKVACVLAPAPPIVEATGATKVPPTAIGSLGYTTQKPTGEVPVSPTRPRLSTTNEPPFGSMPGKAKVPESILAWIVAVPVRVTFSTRSFIAKWRFIGVSPTPEIEKG